MTPHALWKYYGGPGRVKPGDAIPTILRWDPSTDISESCAVQTVAITTLITVVTRTVSPPEVEAITEY